MDHTEEVTSAGSAATEARSSTNRAGGGGPAPAGDSERMVALDALRGIAVLAILVMNIQYFSQVTAAYSNPTLIGPFVGSDFWLWLLARVFFDEKMMAIFSMLYGAGVLLLTSRVEAKGISALPIFLRRSFWLVIFGLLHAYLLWSGDILFSYGVCGLLVYPFRKQASRRLFIIGVLFFGVSSLVYLGYSWSMRSWTPDRIRALEQEIWRPTPQQIATQVNRYRGGWRTQMSQRIPEARLQQTQALLCLTLWRAGGLMLVGMALYKVRLLSGSLAASLYWKLAGLGFAMGIPMVSYGAYCDIVRGWDFRYAFLIGSQFNYWGSLGVALGWICLVMLMCNTPSLNRWSRRFAAVGRMAFSNYILETIICTTIFYGHGLGQFGRLNRAQGMGIVLASWILIVRLSQVWMRRFYFGPLEWFWRSLTYQARQPFRRAEP